jgi:hypothetical protein
MKAYASFIFKINVTPILNFKKLKKKLHMHLHLLGCYALIKSFYRKSTYHVTCVKKDKIK